MTENIVNNTANKDEPLAQCLLPNFCDVRVLFILVLLTEVLAIIFAMAAASNSEQFWDYLALSSLLMLWIALLNAAVLCARRPWLHKQKGTRCLSMTFCLMMITSLLVSLLASKAGSLLYIQLDTSSNSLFLLYRTLVSSS